jgi:hypothetical protein
VKIEHVSKWTLKRLKFKNRLEVRQMMYNYNEEIEARIGGECIAKNLVPNDNVAIFSDIIDPFWILVVDQCPRFVESKF